MDQFRWEFSNHGHDYALLTHITEGQWLFLVTDEDNIIWRGSISERPPHCPPDVIVELNRVRADYGLDPI